MTAPAWLSPLTDREMQILRMLADGYERTEIARRLGTVRGTSLGTVKADMVKLYGRLGARNAAHAVALGHQYGLLGADALAGGAR
ncbi:response regulator transcription factor [Actinoplanes sp. CA-142083]|uniref:response regulator transcription factor n=1 Tax=Actinoplanes sp. CA-142083 TaxID=3239903 RepID=UPI003D8DA774